MKYRGFLIIESSMVMKGKFMAQLAPYHWVICDSSECVKKEIDEHLEAHGIEVGTYRCSGCDGIRDEEKITFVPWSKNNDADVGICHECEVGMKKMDAQFALDWVLSLAVNGGEES